MLCLALVPAQGSVGYTLWEDSLVKRLGRCLRTSWRGRPVNAPQQYSPLTHLSIGALASAEQTLPSCSQQPSWVSAWIDTAWILQHYKHQETGWTSHQSGTVILPPKHWYFILTFLQNGLRGVTRSSP